MRNKLMVVEIPRQCPLVFVLKFNRRKDEEHGSKNSKNMRSGKRKF
jgi:hypothetical protein